MIKKEAWIWILFIMFTIFSLGWKSYLVLLTIFIIWNLEEDKNK